MAKIFPGRYSARMEGPFVVFLIGMRVNNLFALGRWMLVARAMGPMIQELYANKDSGFISAESCMTWRGAMLLQYWRSFEDLHTYAHARDTKHMPAWTAFNRSIGGDGSVGIWHETYQVQAGGYECIYGNMPLWGLGKVGEHIPIAGRMESAKGRMGEASDAN